ncbi:hypothetical protein NE865_13031 [Phthorimaea operculella]|nr:hypothetical protein NE865_13031 [Phthorimaea operculella]
MELIELIIITLQIASTFSKKRHRQHDSEPDESIENLLYFKDCKHKNEATVVPVMLSVTEPPPPPPRRDPVCPCPRMCCSMCCDCTGPEPMIGRQLSPLQMSMQSLQQPQSPSQMMSHMQQPQMPPMVRPNKRKPNMMGRPNAQIPLLPPIGSRRELGGFTRENIKNLISHDQDIKKILKDLVRVTMTKVDLVEAVNARRNMELHKYTTTTPITRDDDEDYVD